MTLDDSNPAGNRMAFSLIRLLQGVTVVAVLCGAVSLGDWMDQVPGRGVGGWMSAAAAYLTIGLARYQLGSSSLSRRRQAVLLGGLLILLLPYIYSFAGLLEEEFRQPPSKWIGDPIWIYATGILGFTLMDGWIGRESQKMRIGILIAEAIIVVPLWTIGWILIQALLGWWWM